MGSGNSDSVHVGDTLSMKTYLQGIKSALPEDFALEASVYASYCVAALGAALFWASAWIIVA